MKLILFANLLMVVSAQINCSNLRDTWTYCYTWTQHCAIPARADAATLSAEPPSSGVDMNRCFLAGALQTPAGLWVHTTFTDGDDRLGCRLFNVVAPTTGNFVFSPASIYVGLGMIADGARGITQMQLYQTLFPGLQGQDRAVAFQYAALLQTLNPANLGGNVLRMVNALYADVSMRPEQQFAQRMTGCFGNSVMEVNFRTSSEQARRDANRWISDATSGLITNVLPPGSVTANSRLILLTAAYMNASWSTAFDFSYRSTTTQLGSSVPMMSGTPYVRYMSDPVTGDILIGLPYSQQNLIMWIVMPRVGQTRTAIESNSCQFAEWKTRALAQQPVRLRLQMPEFRIGYGMRLKQNLQSIGLTDMFLPTADFSGMTTAERLFLSNAQHKAYIQVTKQGTEGGSRTGVMVRRPTDGQSDTPQTVVVDRPFLFTIDDLPSRMTLFMGKVSRVP